MSKIKLGDKVKDTLTPYKGIVVGVSQWINGCDRVVVQSPILKDGKPQEAEWFDESQLKVIKPRKKPVKKKKTGGPNKKVSIKVMRGF